jgi:hypothetical protein
MSKPFEVFTNLFGRLKEHKVSIHNAVDVGCYKGEWSKRLNTYILLKYKDF